MVYRDNPRVKSRHRMMPKEKPSIALYHEHALDHIRHRVPSGQARRHTEIVAGR